MILTMTGKLQPLDEKFQIVGPDGRPTLYFTRWAQQRMQDIGDAISQEQALLLIQEYIDQFALVPGIGIDITPDGKLTSNPTIAAEVQPILDQITDVHGSILFRGAAGWQALGPGPAGRFLRTNGAGADPTWAPGGGGSTPWYWAPPAAADFTLGSADATLPILTDDADLGLNMNFGTLVTGNIRRFAWKALPAAGAANWEVVVRLDIAQSNTSGNMLGLMAYESATGRNLMWTYHAAASTSYIRADRSTALNANVTLILGLGQPSAPMVPQWLKLSFNNTTGIYSWSHSRDGKNWILINGNTVAKATVFTNVADRVGFVSYTETNSANWIKSMNCEHWSQSW